MTIEKDNSISINFGEGIGQSVLSDFSDMMGVNVDDNPGSVSVNLKFNKITQTTASQEVTFDDTTSIITSSGSVEYRGGGTGRAVVFSTTGALPTGITAGAIYYILEITYNTFRICDTLKKSIDASAYTSFSGAGTGEHTMTFIDPKAITYWTKNGQGRIFALDIDQRVWFCHRDAVSYQWYLIAGNSQQGNGDGNGIIYYKGYILVFGNSFVDALTDIQSGSDAIVWKQSFNTINISSSMSNDGRGACPFLSVNDDAIYFYNGISNYGQPHKIGLFEQVAGKTFSPTDPSTFSFVEEVTTLPNENGQGVVTAIRELGENLVFSTNTDKVYFWDKKSPSFTNFLQIQEYGIRSMEVIGDLAYLFIKNSGSIYICNTSSSSLLLKLPEQLSDQYYLYGDGLDMLEVTDTDVYKRELLFSITIGVSTTTVKNYIMSYNVDTKKITKKNISSFGEITERNGAFYGKINSIFVDKRNILISSSSFDISDDAYTYAAESLLYRANFNMGSMTYYVYDNYEPYIITGLITYGDVYNKKTIRELFVSFLRPLASNQGIKVYYRRNDESSWTILRTIDYTTYGAIKEIKIPTPITDIIDLQIKIELDGYNLTSPRLKSLRLIP